MVIVDGGGDGAARVVDEIVGSGGQASAHLFDVVDVAGVGALVSTPAPVASCDRIGHDRLEIDAMALRPGRRDVTAGLTAAMLAPTLLERAQAQVSAPVTVKVGVLTDMTGLAADVVGEGSVLAARMAAEDAAPPGGPVKAEIVFADHQNKPDIALAIARQWFDQEGVDAIADVPNSSVSLAINGLAKLKNKIALFSGAGSSEITGAQCSPNTIQWTYDTWAQAHGLAKLVTERGGKTWFFILADFAFAYSMAHDATAVIEERGGKVIGSVVHPYASGLDFASYVVQAQASKADVIGIISPADYFQNIFKQAVEFGVTQKMVGFAVFLTDIRALGPKVAQGLELSDAFYWDLNDGTRAWSKRFADRLGGRPPTSIQAGVYGVTNHYLKAVRHAGRRDTDAVMAAMKALPTDDPLFGQGSIREDGRVLHSMYLFDVKTPAQVKGTWDLYNLIATIPPGEAFRPMGEGGCAFVATK